MQFILDQSLVTEGLKVPIVTEILVSLWLALLAGRLDGPWLSIHGWAPPSLRNTKFDQKWDDFD